MACRVNIKQNGDVEVSGENANIYYQARAILGNEVDALDVYGVSLTEEYRDSGLPYEVSSIMSYVEENNISKANYFTSQELVDIYNTPNYQDFLGATTINGRFSLDRENMLNFYSPQEADAIMETEGLQNQVHSMWYKMQSAEESLEDFGFKDPIIQIPVEGVNSLGKSRIQNSDETYNKVGKIAAGAQTVEELEERISTDPSVEAEAISNSLQTETEVVQEFSNKKALPQYVENPVTGELEKKVYNSTESRLLSAFDPTQDFNPLQEDIVAIISLDSDVVSNNTDPVRGVLEDIQTKAAEVGLDLRGLSENAKSVEDTQEFLIALSQFLADPTRIESYSQQYNEFFDVQEDTGRPVIKETNETNSFSVNTNSSEIDLFGRYSIIRLEGNIYKKVDRDSADITEDLYQKALEDPTIFDEGIYYPYGFDKDGNFSRERLQNRRYKPQIKEAIREEVENQSREYQTTEGYNTETLYELSAHKVANKARQTIINKSEYHNFLNETNEAAFIESFLGRLNKHIIKNNIDSPLTFTQRGVELNYGGINSALEALNALPKSLQQDLVKYAKITGNLDSVLTVQPHYFTSNVETNPNFNRNFYTNFKDQLPAYRGSYEKLSEDSVRTDSEDAFIKIRGEVFENIEGDLYGRVERQGERSWSRKEPNISGQPTTRVALNSLSDKAVGNVSSNVPQNISSAENVETIVEDTTLKSNELRRVTDLEGNTVEINQEDLITYPSDVGDINYIRDTNGELIMIKEVEDVAIPMEESMTYNQLLSLPGVTDTETLNMYKNLFKKGNYDWKNTDTLNC